MTATEYTASDHVILVDEEDHEIGIAEKLAAHQNNLLHRAFSIFIFREEESQHVELLLQQRAMHKYHSPGLWTNTCCSHPRSGETVLAAGQRRLQEELGIQAALKNVGWFYYNAHFPNGLSEHEIDHVLVGMIRNNQVIIPNPEEAHQCRWIEIDNLRKEIKAQPEQFTPWLKPAFSLVLSKIFDTEL